MQPLSKSAAAGVYASADNQSFTFNVVNNGVATSTTATVQSTTAGSTLTQVLSSLNNQLNAYGISASTGSDGTLQFTSANAFTVQDNQSTTGTSPLTNETAGTGLADNSANYTVDGAAAWVVTTAAETLTLTSSTGAATAITIASGDTKAQTMTAINALSSPTGVSAVLNAAGTGISLQSATSFSATDTTTGAAGIFAAASTNINATAPTSTAVSNGTAAITAIDSAISALGLVQGSIGAGENKLQYATNLAQSQITSYSAAESQIKDADVAAQAANLTKAQVLVQTSVAALAQANSAPQSILKLLQ